jgi:hypothetical protein
VKTGPRESSRHRIEQGRCGRSRDRISGGNRAIGRTFARRRSGLILKREQVIDLETRSSELYFFLTLQSTIRKVPMKTATYKGFRTAWILLAGVLLMGNFSATVAGDGSRSFRARHAAAQTPVILRDTGASATPRPVVDETPIDPELLKSNPPPRRTDTDRPPVKRTTVRRR